MQTERDRVQAVLKKKKVLWGVTKSLFTVMYFIKWWIFLVKDALTWADKKTAIQANWPRKDVPTMPDVW